MNARNVNIALHEQFESAIGGFPNREVQAAVGYLASWAMCGEKHGAAGNTVTIYGSREGCLAATYRNGDGTVTYSLFGLRDEATGTYSFHS